MDSLGAGSWVMDSLGAGALGASLCLSVVAANSASVKGPPYRVSLYVLVPYRLGIKHRLGVTQFVTCVLSGTRRF